MVKTRKSLWAAGFALLVSIVLLIGTTFAWFTDSITNSGNKIQAGTLDVSLEEWDSTANEGKGRYVAVGENPIFNYGKWEPGYTDFAAVKIANNGTLALKYKLDIIADDATDLAEVIDVYYYDNGIVTAEAPLPSDFSSLEENGNYQRIGTLAEILSGENTSSNGVANGHLEAGKADYAIIALHMQESAGNEYQGANIGTTFDIVLNATQYTHEEDGFGNNQYDKDATLPTVIESTDYDTLKDAVAAAAEGDTVVLKENQSPGSTLDISKDMILNLGSNIINGDNNSSNGIRISGDDKNITIKATSGGVQMDNQRCITFSSSNSDILIDGGNYSLEGTTNPYLMEAKGGENNNVTIQNINYNGDRGVSISESDNNNILIKDSVLDCSGYSAIYIGGNNNVCTLENVVINGGTRLMAANSLHSGGNEYSKIYIKSGTYNCRLTTNDNCTISITGGSFSQDPTRYLASGYEATKDSSTGMWVVTAKQ